MITGDIEAADRWTAEYEAQQRAASGPVIVEVSDEPNESLWTPEEFAAMQAAVSADREKRQAAEGVERLGSLFKRSRNH